jgi:hypothetical protein
VSPDTATRTPEDKLPDGQLVTGKVERFGLLVLHMEYASSLSLWGIKKTLPIRLLTYPVKYPGIHKTTTLAYLFDFTYFVFACQLVRQTPAPDLGYHLIRGCSGIVDCGDDRHVCDKEPREGIWVHEDV